MASPIFEAMNKPNQGKLDIIRQYNTFRQNPINFMLQNKGISILQEYQNDPKGAIQYLINSGQMTEEQLAYLKGMAQKMGMPLN